MFTHRVAHYLKQSVEGVVDCIREDIAATGAGDHAQLLSVGGFQPFVLGFDFREEKSIMFADDFEYVIPGNGSDRKLARPLIVPFFDKFVVNFLYGQHAAWFHGLELTYLIFQGAGVVLGLVHDLEGLEEYPKWGLEVITLDSAL